MLPTVSYYITFVPIIAVKNSCSGISDIMHDPNCNKHPIQHNYGWHVVKSLLGGLKQCSTDETTFINPYIQWCLCVLTHGIRGVLVGCLTTEMPNICSRNFDYDRGVSKKTSQRFLFCLSFILPFLRKKIYKLRHCVCLQCYDAIRGADTPTVSTKVHFYVALIQQLCKRWPKLIARRTLCDITNKL